MNVAVDGLVNTPNGQGETPLHWSTKNGHDAVSRILIEQRADVQQKFAGEDVEAAQSALEWALESHGQLALHWAAKTGRAGVDARSNVDWAFRFVHLRLGGGRFSGNQPNHPFSSLFCKMSSCIFLNILWILNT